ncbi:MAG: immunoglobulin domain-containing protein [Verrucomicrobiota bacterium]
MKCSLLQQCFSACLMLTCLGSLKLNATPLAYDGFAYPAGDSLTNASAQGSDGSFGWGGRWAGANTANATNAATSLFYTDAAGNILVTNGGSVIIGAPSGNTANSQPSRSFNFGTLTGTTYSGLTGPGTYWVSFVMQWVGPVTASSPTNQYVRKGDLTFRTGALTNATSTGTATFTVGSPNAANRLGTTVDTWTTWSGNDAAAGTQNTGLAASSAPLKTPTLVLLRIDLDGGPGNDTVYTWLNWTNLSVEPTLAAASTTNNTANNDGWNNIRFDANGGNATGTNTVLAVDEFRLGNSFADVTPFSSGSVQPPTITIQPVNVTATETYPATFSLTALGTAPFHYQWYFNTSTPLANQTNASMTIVSIQPGDAGNYLCVVTNAGGAVTSSAVTLTVLAPLLPAITVQPQHTTNAIGFPTAFTVSANGSTPLSYQWYFNTSTPLANQTNSTLSFIITATNNAGAYAVIVSNKFGSATSAVATLTVSAFGAAQLPAFPGADGAAKLASGGRGGIVYHVTKLNSALDDPQRNAPGTLLYGLNSGNFPAGPRTIVFDVAGVLHLGMMDTTNWTSGGHAWDSTSRQSINANNLTIAGQTAPGPVIVMGGTLKPSGNNIVIRNITIAAGYGMRAFWEPAMSPPPALGTLPTSFTMDAMDISGQNIMIDHVDAFFGSDELISCNEQANKVTIQYCNNALAQNYQQHGYGHLLQPNSDNKLSFIHNLDAHIRARLPRVGSEVGIGSLNDFRNNVQYNWLGSGPGYSGAEQYSKNNFINNFYLAGNGGDSDWANTEAGGTGIFSGSTGYTSIYAAGNVKDTNKDGGSRTTPFPPTAARTIRTARCKRAPTTSTSA